MRMIQYANLANPCTQNEIDILHRVVITHFHHEIFVIFFVQSLPVPISSFFENFTIYYNVFICRYAMKRSCQKQIWCTTLKKKHHVMFTFSMLSRSPSYG